MFFLIKTQRSACRTLIRSYLFDKKLCERMLHTYLVKHRELIFGCRRFIIKNQMEYSYFGCLLEKHQFWMFDPSLSCLSLYEQTGNSAFVSTKNV